MTLTITITHTDGVILAADRRLMHLISLAHLEDTHSSRIFIEGYQKAFKFAPPHNWVGLVVSGGSKFDFHELYATISANLPNQRLSIKEYVDIIYEFYSNKLTELAEQGLNQPSINPNVITIAGISPQTPFGEIYVIIPERNHISSELSTGIGKMIDTGENYHINEAKKLYYEDLLNRLIVKQKQLIESGLDLSENELILLATIREKNFEVSDRFLDFAQTIEYTKSLIRNTASEQVRLDDYPTVGENVDLIKITEENGSEIISDYENGNYFLADTNLHYISIKCCGKDNLIQYNPQNLDIDLPAKFIKFPEDLFFTCNSCNKYYDLFELLQAIEDCLETNF